MADDRPPRRASSTLKLLLRAVLGFGLAGWIIHRLLAYSGVNLAEEYRHCSLGFLLAATAAYAAGYPIQVLRWRWLLEAQGFHLPVGTLLRLILMGNFFNLFVPGAVGGDVVKAAGLVGQTPGRRVEALLTIFVDRVLGAVGLLTMTAISILISVPFLRAADPRLGLAALFFGVSGTLCVLLLISLTYRQSWGHYRPARALRRFVERILPTRVYGLVRRALWSLDLYRSTPGVLAGCALLSVGIHGIATMVVFLLARAVGEHAIPFSTYLLAVQLSNGVAMIPITPGGLGGRDVVTFAILSAAGASAARASVIPVMYSVMVTLWALLGGLVFILDPLRGQIRGNAPEKPPASRDVADPSRMPSP